MRPKAVVIAMLIAACALPGSSSARAGHRSLAPARPLPGELGFLGAWPATVPPQAVGNGRFDIDRDGNVYVTSFVSGGSPAGSVVVHDLSGKIERVFTFKEPDPADPNRLTAEYASAVAPDGSLWVLGGQNFALHHFARDGTFIGRYARRTGDFPDLYGPDDLAVAPDGSVFVVDTKARRVVHFSASGELLGRFGSTGDGPGQFGDYAPISTPIDGPEGIAIDSSGAIYVADTYNSRIEKFTAGGQYVRSFGEEGRQPGRLRWPSAVAVDGAGRVYTVDRNSSLEVYAPTGKLVWFMGGPDVPYEQVGRLVAASDVAVAPGGKVAVLDGSCAGTPLRCGRVQVFGPGGVVPGGAAPPQVVSAHLGFELGARLHGACPPSVKGLSTCDGLTLAKVTWSLTCAGRDARPGWAVALRTHGEAVGAVGSYRPPGFTGPVFEPAPPVLRFGEWVFADGQDLGTADPRKSNVLAYASSAAHGSGTRTVAVERGVRVFPSALFVCRRRVGLDPHSKSPPAWQEGTREATGPARRAT